MRTAGCITGTAITWKPRNRTWPPWRNGWAGFVADDGQEKLDGHRFLDWPTSENKPAIPCGSAGPAADDAPVERASSDHAGRSRDGRRLSPRLSGGCASTCPERNGSKQAAALLVLAGLARRVDDEPRGARVGRRPGTFPRSNGYYVLQAMAEAGRVDAALGIIRTYWGAMLDKGATTFWEDFNIDWLPNAGRIDELLPTGKKDLHGDFGAYCYAGFRHSLCHGWASGPTAWLSEQVLGVKPLEPGCRRVRIAPAIGEFEMGRGHLSNASGAHQGSP